jgi:hypothetical protein
LTRRRHPLAREFSSQWHMRILSRLFARARLIDIWLLDAGATIHSHCTRSI